MRRELKILMTGARLPVKMSIKLTAANRVKGCCRVRISDWSAARALTHRLLLRCALTSPLVPKQLQRVNMANIRSVKVREKLNELTEMYRLKSVVFPVVKIFKVALLPVLIFASLYGCISHLFAVF